MPRRGELTVGAAIAGLLAAHGVSEVFGIPGVQTLEMHRGLADARIRHVLTRSEVGAAFAADGYARIGGRPAVALLISGPGLTYASTAIAQAYHDSVPLLVISAAPPRGAAGRGLGVLHELRDQQGLMEAVAASSVQIDDPSELPAVLARTFHALGSSRPRPVHVQVPADLLNAPCPELAAEPVAPERPLPEPELVARAAALLHEARTPIVLLGGGAVDAGDQAEALAELLGAPVVLSLNAKGTVADGHPLSVSTTLPCDVTLAALRDADVVLAVGTQFSEVDHYYAPDPLTLDGKLIRVDIDERQLDARFNAEVPLHGDAAATLAALVKALTGRPADQTYEDGRQRAAAIRAGRRWWDRAAPLLPLVDAIGGALPSDATVACDSTQLAYIGQNAWPAQHPRSWMVPSGWGTLGCALPMAVGGAIAAPARPTFAVAGDGGLLFTIGEMATAAALRLPLTVLLWNNDGYQEMKDEYEEAGIAPVGVDAAARDYLRIAEGFGWHAERPASREAACELIAAASARSSPMLIELTPELS